MSVSSIRSFPVLWVFNMFKSEKVTSGFHRRKSSCSDTNSVQPHPPIPRGLRFNYIHPIKASENLKSSSANSHVMLRLSSMKLHWRNGGVVRIATWPDWFLTSVLEICALCLRLTSHYSKSLITSKSQTTNTPQEGCLVIFNCNFIIQKKGESLTLLLWRRSWTGAALDYLVDVGWIINCGPIDKESALFSSRHVLRRIKSNLNS